MTQEHFDILVSDWTNFTCETWIIEMHDTEGLPLPAEPKKFCFIPEEVLRIEVSASVESYRSASDRVVQNRIDALLREIERLRTESIGANRRVEDWFILAMREGRFRGRILDLTGRIWNFLVPAYVARYGEKPDRYSMAVVSKTAGENAQLWERYREIEDLVGHYVDVFNKKRSCEVEQRALEELLDQRALHMESSREIDDNLSKSAILRELLATEFAGVVQKFSTVSPKIRRQLISRAKERYGADISESYVRNCLHRLDYTKPRE